MEIDRMKILYSTKILKAPILVKLENILFRFNKKIHSEV